MNRKRIVMIMTAAAVLAAMAGTASSVQDRSFLKVPNGLAFSEFRGYEGWDVISVSGSAELTAVILGNPAMIAAYRAGMPDNGKPFPDGAKMAKIHWKKTQSTDPGSPVVAGDLHDVDFMVKDAKRFAASGGWGYAVFTYDVPTETLMPTGEGSNCGHACHTVAAKRDFVFTTYPKR